MMASGGSSLLASGKQVEGGLERYAAANCGRALYASTKNSPSTLLARQQDIFLKKINLPQWF